MNGPERLSLADLLELNEKATSRIVELVKQKDPGDVRSSVYDDSEIIAARALLDKDQQHH